MDARDDPDAPHVLPRSDQILDWVKVQPVQIRSPDDVTDILEDDRLIALSSLFHLNRVARTVYRNNGTLADVVYLEADTPADAYGCYSISTSSQGTFHRADGSIRTVEPWGIGDSIVGRLHAAWQGRVCVLVRCHPADAGTQERDIDTCDPVLSKIVFEIPSSDPPFLLFAVPSDYREKSRFWSVRTTRALPVGAHPAFEELQPDVVDRRLDLDGNALLHLAAVHVGEYEEDNLIWVVEYPHPDAAASAWQRYQASLEAEETSIDKHTLILEPVGRLMAGSWTAGQESMQILLPHLRDMLEIE